MKTQNRHAGRDSCFCLIARLQQDKEERDHCADAEAAKARCQDLELKLAAAKQTSPPHKPNWQRPIPASQSRSASKTQISELNKTIETLTKERDEALKTAEQSSLNLLNMLAQ